MSVTPGQVVRQVKDSFGKSADQNDSFLVANKDHLRGPRVSKGNLYLGRGARGSLHFVSEGLIQGLFVIACNTFEIIKFGSVSTHFR